MSHLLHNVQAILRTKNSARKNHESERRRKKPKKQRTDFYHRSSHTENTSHPTGKYALKVIFRCRNFFSIFLKFEKGR